MNLSTYYKKDYSGGLHDTADSREIGLDENSVLQNWDITDKGKLKRRNGLTLTGNSTANPITGLDGYIRSDSSKDLLSMEGTNLRYLNGTSWSVLDNTFTLGGMFWMQNAEFTDKIFISNEDNNLKYWDRSSTILNACLTNLGAGVPHGNVLRWHKNFMFTLGNVNVGGTKYRHRIYWSAMNDPVTWDTVNDFFEIPGNGTAISAVDLGNSLVIFKEHAIQYLDGWGDDSWRITASASNVSNLDEQVGMIAPRGACRVGNEIWFIDDEAIIRRIYQTDFNAFRKDVISNNIYNTLQTINKSVLSKAVAWSNNNKVYFAIPTGTSTTNNTVCVYDITASNRTNREAWSIYTGWSVNIMADYAGSATPDLYIGDATTGNVYKHTGSSDNGVAIDARCDDGIRDFNTPEKYKRYVFGYGSGKTSGSLKVNTYASVNRSPYAKIDDLDLATQGSRLGPTGSFRLGPTGDAILSGFGEKRSKFYFTTGGGSARGTNLQMSFRHNVLNEQPEINGFSVHFKERVLR